MNGARLASFAAAILAICALAPAHAGTRQQATVILPEDPAQRALFERFGFAEAVVDGDMVYLSGVVVVLGEDGDMGAAFERAFAYMADILARAGSSWDDVLDMTSYHTDLTSSLGPMSAVKERYVKPPFLAWTAIGVSRLYPDRGIVEIKVTARRSAGD